MFMYVLIKCFKQPDGCTNVKSKIMWKLIKHRVFIMLKNKLKIVLNWISAHYNLNIKTKTHSV